MNTIRDAAVPTADSVPFTVSVRVEPLNFTTTPGSTVSVTPAATVTLPFKMYGLPAAVQVVFELYVVVPTIVAARALRGSVNDDGPNTTSSDTNSSNTGTGRASERIRAQAQAGPT